MNPPPGSSNGQPSSSLAETEGVELVLEASDEWKIQEIGYDGVEKYLAPETFSDYVGKLARKVEWTKIVGSDVDYENGHVEPDDELDDEDVAKGKNTKFVVPEVGPWSGVAKQLHEAVSQLNLLIDNLNIAKQTDYMKPLTILDPVSTIENNTDLINMNRGTQWIWKRRALHEAAQVLETAAKLRQRAESSMGLSDDYISHMRRRKFFEELQQLREVWRVRKSGDYIYGDLSYHIFGSKYESGALFDIGRRQITNVNTNIPILEVSVPKDLARRSMLFVSIVKDDASSGNLFKENTEESMSFMNVDMEKAKMIHWKQSLKWAQNTLLLRDIFNTLCKNAVKMRNRLSIIRDNVLLIKLFDDYLLRCELKFYPFEIGELKEEGDPYLTRILREMVIGFECTKFMRPQLFCTMPITHLPEHLDLRGCGAFTNEQIEKRAVVPKSLLERLLEVAAHYQLVKLVTEVTEKCTEILDPVFQHRWLYSGRKLSRLMMFLTSKDYEPNTTNMRTAFFVDITTNDVTVETKDGIQMKCHRDPERIMYAYQYAVCCYSLNMVTVFTKNQWFTPFQTIHANVYALDEHGNPAPSIIICNQPATRSILFIFHVGADPEIRIRKFLYNDQTAKPEEHKWRKLNYQKLYGSTLCKKLEVLLSFMKDG